MNHVLMIRWGVSRGRDTYGWNLVTLEDEKGRKYRTRGGGYDMIGTVLADWLQANYLDRIKQYCNPVDYDNPCRERGYRSNEDYGFFTKGGKFWLDGGCGRSSIEAIAKKSGLKISSHWNKRKKITDYFTVEEILTEVIA